jgi:hypothetical protein
VVSICPSGDSYYQHNSRDTDSGTVTADYFYESERERDRFNWPNLSRFIWLSTSGFKLTADQLLEEFHGHWMDLAMRGVVKSVFDFERVYRDFKRSKRML